MVLPSLHRVPPVAKACRIGLVPVICNCPLHHTSHVPCLACFFLGGLCVEDGRSSRMFAQAIQLPSRGVQSPNRLKSMGSIEDQIGWYNQNIAERWHFIGRANNLIYSNILEWISCIMIHQYIRFLHSIPSISIRIECAGHCLHHGTNRNRALVSWRHRVHLGLAKASGERKACPTWRALYPMLWRSVVSGKE